MDNGTRNHTAASEVLPLQYYRNRNAIPTAPLPDPIAKNIDAIIELQARDERGVPNHQRVLETISTFFGRPIFLYSLIIGIVSWIGLNTLSQSVFAIPQLDPPPFNLLERLVDFGSLLISTGVLIRQTRQEKLAEQRAQLVLQLNLLSDQKMAKLIALNEELRNDLPNVIDRVDPEAEAMQQATDPCEVVDTLQQNLTQELEQLQKQVPTTEADRPL